MGKTKNKNRDEIEFYRGIIRDLEKQVRTLNKELQYYKKRNHIFDSTKQDEEISRDSEDTIIKLQKKVPCDDCGKGHYEEFEILDKVYGTCNVCDHRKKLK